MNEVQHPSFRLNATVWRVRMTEDRGISNFSYPKQILISLSHLRARVLAKTSSTQSLHAAEAKANSISIQINKVQAVFTAATVLIPIGSHNTSRFNCVPILYFPIYSCVCSCECGALAGAWKCAHSRHQHKGAFDFNLLSSKFLDAKLGNRLHAFCVVLRAGETDQFFSALHEFAYTHNKVKRALWYVTGKNGFPLALAVFIYVSGRQ